MPKNKSQIIADYRKNENDTGSVEVQIALLSNRINNLNKHFETHAKDFGSKRGLLILVGQRRRFLKYLEKHNAERYKELINSLGLRK